MKLFFSRKVLFTFALISIIISCKVPANLVQSEKPENKSTGLEKYVDALVQPLVDSSEIAGTAVGVMRNDSILLLKSYGYADLEFNVALPVNASFEIGSMTKQFTAVAIMQLVEKGLLNLDEDISKYLKIDFKKEVITARQLLHHTSGIKEVRLGDIMYHNYPRDTVLSLIQKAPFDFKPGTEMLYNNRGYFLLGLLIEKLTGQTYEEYITNNLFFKAGMKNSYLSDQETVIKRRAHGYNNVSKDGKLTRAEQPYFRWNFSAGALSSTVEDLLRWNQALHTSDKILKRETYQELIKVGRLTDGTLLRYAKGLQVFHYKGYQVIGHGGSGSGVLCDSRYFPEQKLTIIVLQNTYRRASESDISLPIADKLLPPQKNATEKFSGDLSLYQGTYKGPFDLKVDVVDSKLVIKRSWQTTGDTLTYKGNQHWALGNDLYSFKIENGQVKEIHWDPISAYIKLKKIK